MASKSTPTSTTPSSPPANNPTTKSSPTSQPLLSTLFTFTVLYLTTLFSLDSWRAARNSPYRAPASDANATFAHPATTAQPPAPDSYQGRMHGWGNTGPRGGGGRGRVSGFGAGGVDSRPPLKMGGSSGCGGCMG